VVPILLYPGTREDIDRVDQPRTSVSAADPMSNKKPAPGSIGPDFLTQPSAREQRVNWDDFPVQIEKDKLVHVVTDGGANPNPGPADWSAIFRQNGVCAFNFGH
jgi:hypothetical protein